MKLRMFNLCRVIVTSFICITSQPLLAISSEDYKTHCSTADGRKKLVALLPAESRYDIEQQATGSGVDTEEYLVEYMERMCAYIVPGSVNSDSTTQSWTFTSANFHEPLEGEELRTLTLTQDPPRCGPRCEGSFVLTVPSEKWQACRVRYTSNYHSDGANRFHDNATAWLEIVPDQWVDEFRFRGFKFSADAGPRSYIEITNLEFDIVISAMPVNRRKELGCVSSSTYVEHLGHNECSEDRKGIRNSDNCIIVHRAVGARRHIQHPAMRKVSISKPAGNTGREKVLVKIGGGAPKTYTVMPGKSYVLFSPPKYTDDRPVSVEVITQELGVDGKSQYTLVSEWNKL